MGACRGGEGAAVREKQRHKVWLGEEEGGYNQQLQVQGGFHFVDGIPIVLKLERQKEEKVVYYIPT